ncbi:hypothetical protein OAP63_14075 [Vibrio sp.]|nr:hypothetical protein [Vibrio sp.]
MDSKLLQRVKSTPKCDWPVSNKEQSGIGNFLGLYGSEHIAATEFVIGAALVQYGVTATDIIIGLFIGNIMAVLSFTFFCAAIATNTRLTLYSYLRRIMGEKMQKVYNVVLGLGLSCLAAAGISISATAIRSIFDVPIQLEWYPTSLKFIFIVLVLGAVIIFIAAKGFEGVAKFASTCVPWMISLFFVAFLVTMPQLLEATGAASVHSFSDFIHLMNNHVWTGSGSATGSELGIQHVIGFAWICNLAWHIGLNDMSILRFAKSYKYGFASSIGMFLGHFCAWIIAGIMGATAGIILNIPLADLDPGEVTFTLLGYTGLIAVVIAGWTTANPTIYRITLSFNVIFNHISREKLTYIIGSIITVSACFPGIQDAGSILIYLGLAVEGVGAICITEHYVFPRLGYTRYWNHYCNGKGTNWAATLSWALSLVFIFSMILTGTMHQNLVFIPAFFVAAGSYTILASLMGAKASYEDKEKAEQEYDVALLDYVNQLNPIVDEPKVSGFPLALTRIGFVSLAAFVIGGIACSSGVLELESFKTLALSLSLVYFFCNAVAMAVVYQSRIDPEATEENGEEDIETKIEVQK